MFDFEITLFWIYSFYLNDLHNPSNGYITILGCDNNATFNTAISLSGIPKGTWVDNYEFYYHNNNGRGVKVWFQGNVFKWYKYSDGGNDSDAQFNIHGKRYCPLLSPLNCALALSELYHKILFDSV